MKRALVSAVVILLVAAAPPVLAGSEPGPTSMPSDPAALRVAADSVEVGVANPDSVAASDSSLVFRLEVGNRMFPDWKEEQQVRLGQSFPLGDSESWARAPRFVADFRLDGKRVISASAAWNNPALQILVYEDSTAVDSTWAFRDFPPHYSARSFFSFKLLEILLPKAEGK